jgi:2,4-diaminopentanoate dehydrogenase
MTASTPAKPLRVVQWATGNIGSRSLRHVIEDPALDLVGVYVTAPAKAGRDAGDLAGLPATGVLATSSADDIVKLNADCVLYMPAACANRAVNAIPYIVAAAPGIRTTTDLPQIIASLG